SQAEPVQPFPVLLRSPPKELPRSGCSHLVRFEPSLRRHRSLGRPERAWVSLETAGIGFERLFDAYFGRPSCVPMTNGTGCSRIRGKAMFKRPVLLSLLAALAVALPLQSMLASLAPAAGSRPVKKANQATLPIRVAGARILL